MNKKELFSQAANEAVDALKAEMLECEAMIPLTMEAAIEAGIQLRGCEYIYQWLTEVTDHIGLKAAQERNKRTADIMQKFMP